MKRLVLLGIGLLLTACAARTPLPLGPPILATPLPATLQIQREQAGEQQFWWLVVQAEGPALRWSLIDPLGVPLARQRFQDGAWRADGLLPPNGEALELFAALLFALTPTEALASSFAPASWQALADGQRRLTPDWLISYRSPLDFTLNHAHDLSYRVHVLSDQEIP
ncbi:hypothetical protein PH586_00530 [Pseudomonas sp. SA3-5]|uniref:DUF3261 domain-containing protein n=1 Tax=Pseudomonas aestuarii TaxID=3018340 RepID=A0ABT4XB09_9PSED|nr:hypothetical protein [Pseudomonas aestuarii]MDA7084872.1 hypothetical protein [Pseudomonas aestuarii]